MREIWGKRERVLDETKSSKLALRADTVAVLCGVYLTGHSVSRCTRAFACTTRFGDIHPCSAAYGSGTMRGDYDRGCGAVATTTTSCRMIGWIDITLYILSYFLQFTRVVDRATTPYDPSLGIMEVPSK